MNKRSFFSFLLVLLTAIPTVSFGWGKAGHGIVAEIAFSMLDKSTKDKVNEYLGPTTIEEASTWMDEVRKDHSYDYMKPWHYVNILKGKEYAETSDDNIVNALNKAIDELGHKDKLSREDIKKNLMIIFHLAGDMQMPLHCGYASDKGGNDVEVQYLGRKANLHWVWDNEMIVSEKITIDDCLPLLKMYTKQEIAALRRTDIKSWIYEPRALLSNVYDFKDGVIDQVYVDRNKKVVETQLLIAGIRLAAVLEEVMR